MIDPIRVASTLAASGMEAQSTRLRVTAENIANARSTGATPGADPYQRKTVSFASMLDREIGAATVEVKRIDRDRTPFQVEYDPGNPAADAL